MCMTIRPIHLLPDDVLRQRAAEIAAIDDTVRALADDMLATMYAAAGIGLAAPQIGVLQRIIVLDVSRDGEAPAPLVMINPEITWSSQETSVYDEGCLSIPEYYEEVTRPAEVKVRFLDREGAEQEIHATDILATCVQHEIDHLNGILFIDYISKLKRDMVVRKFTKNAKRTGGAPILPEPRLRKPRETSEETAAPQEEAS